MQNLDEHTVDTYVSEHLGSIQIRPFAPGPEPSTSQDHLGHSPSSGTCGVHAVRRLLQEKEKKKIMWQEKDNIKTGSPARLSCRWQGQDCCTLSLEFPPNRSSSPLDAKSSRA